MRPPHSIIKVKDAGARWCPRWTLIFTTVSAEHFRTQLFGERLSYLSLKVNATVSKATCMWVTMALHLIVEAQGVLA